MNKVVNVIKKHKVITVICVIALVVVAVVAFMPKNESAGYSEEVASTRDLVTYNSFVGNVGFTTEMNALSKVSAEVKEVLLEAGDSVKAGDIIAVLDSKTLEENIEKSELALKNQKIVNEHTLADAQRAYDNFKYALDNGLNSSLNSAKNQLENLQKNYNTLLKNFDSYLVQLEAAVNSRPDNAGNDLISNKNAYETSLNELAMWEKTVEDLNIEIEKDGKITEEEKSKLDSYTELLVSAEQLVERSRADYEHSIRSYADNIDPAFKTIVDNMEDTLIAIENAEESYAAVELQVNQQLESYEAALVKAKDSLNLESAEKDLQLLKETLEDYKITAPCDGVITALSVEEGNMSAAGSVAATVSNLGELEISIKVDEYSILNTEVGKDVLIYIDSIGRTYNGKITWIANNATIENGVSYFKATVEFVADEYVRGGMSVEVRLTKSQSLAVVSVSVDAINYRNDNSAYVLVKNADGHLTERDVALGVSDGIHVEITEGLTDGEKIYFIPSSFIFEIPGM